METTVIKELIKQLPIPACVVGTDGKILAGNEKMKDVILFSDIEGKVFFTLTGVKRDALIEASKKDEYLETERNDKTFVLMTKSNLSAEEEIVVYFCDITEKEAYRKQAEDSRSVIAFIDIDNYDELMSSTTTDSKRAVPTVVDRIVRNWADEYDAPVLSIEDDEYVLICSYAQAMKMREDNFTVLDEVRGIETQIDFPVSLSIGMGLSSESMVESKELARAALELALGRGGDQAVIKIDDLTYMYGGTLQSMEKGNRGKSRVIAHALKQLIKDSSKVLIMGHRWPDMDSFGAAIGAASLCKYLDKDAYIVIDEYNDALDEIYTRAENTEDYKLIKEKKALELVDEKSLVIIVDCNRPALVECSELLELGSRHVVVDHHRRAEDSISNVTLSYIESYASSSCELMTEILQYSAQKRIINKFESEALLAGIMVDTNQFSTRSGVRTFEAAAWLKRAGADTSEVKRMFQNDMEQFQAKADAIADAEYSEDGIVFARTDFKTSDSTIINAQVADSLLMVKGVRASFVIGTNEKNQTIVSARSLGDINVQVIMESLGGGGHLNAAAAQLYEEPDVVKQRIEKELRKQLKSEEDMEEE